MINRLHTPGMPRTAPVRQEPRQPEPAPPAGHDTVVIGGVAASVLLGVGIIAGTIYLNPPPKPPQAQEMPAPAPVAPTPITG